MHVAGLYEDRNLGTVGDCGCGCGFGCGGGDVDQEVVGGWWLVVVVAFVAFA